MFSAKSLELDETWENLMTLVTKSGQFSDCRLPSSNPIMFTKLRIGRPAWHLMCTRIHQPQATIIIILINNTNPSYGFSVSGGKMASIRKIE